MGDRARPASEVGQPSAHPRKTWPGAGKERPALPMDGPRASMMRRQARLPLMARIALFEALSRDASWARAATRLR